jgi:hypothetical protein
MAIHAKERIVESVFKFFHKFLNSSFSIFQMFIVLKTIHIRLVNL